MNTLAEEIAINRYAPVQRIAIEHRCHINDSFSEYESTYYNVADIQDFEPSFTNAEIANVLDQLYRHGDAYEFFTSATGRLLETVIYRLRSI